MAIEQTLSIIKPNATETNVIGEILAHYEREGLTITQMRLAILQEKEAESFYKEHREKPFFKSLVDFMTSGISVLVVLEGENAIEQNRKIMGHTDPAQAEKGTIRQKYGDNIEANAVHGSDSMLAARRETEFFFPELKIFNMYKDVA